MRIVYAIVGILWIVLGGGIGVQTLVMLHGAPDDAAGIAAHLVLGSVGSLTAVTCGFGLLREARKWTKVVVHLACVVFGLYSIAYVLIEGGASGAKPFVVAVALLVLVGVTELLQVNRINQQI